MKMSRKRSNVDTEKAVRGVWLVKVPKYLSEIWEANAGSDVGRLRLTTTMKGTDVKLLSKPGIQQALINQPGPSTARSHLQKAPEEHSFFLNDVKAQNMQVMMEDKAGLNEEVNIKSGKLAYEGRVVKKADCTPIAGSEVYMKMKIAQIQRNMQPGRTVKLLDRAVVTNKPVKIHQEDMARIKQKKEGNKAVRSDRDVLMNMLFQAFEKHQYYRLQDLQQLTQQPGGYVKEILQEIAVYNSAPPHKNMWELKPEYRNYKVNK